MRAAAAEYVRAPRVIACWAMGITQHEHGVANVQEIVNLLLLRGNIGVPGAGPCPVRGHSNVQGDRTVGITEKPSAAFLDALAREFDFAPPRAPGTDVVAAIRAMRDGRARAFIGMGGNFAVASPDSALTAAALERCDLTVQVSTTLNRTHLHCGREAYVLPCLGRTERDVQHAGAQFVTVEDSMSVVHRSEGRLEPASPHLRSEVAIAADLARAVLGADSTGAVGAVRVELRPDPRRDRARRAGLLRLQPPRARAGRLRAAERRAPAALRHARRARPLHRARAARRRDRRGTLPPHHAAQPRPVQHHDLRPRRPLPRHHAAIAAWCSCTATTSPRRASREGQRVDLTSHFRGETRCVRGFRTVAYDVPRGCAAAYFPEANPLVALDSVAAGSHTPTYKSIEVSISPRSS